jgi:hypothetical protein
MKSFSVVLTEIKSLRQQLTECQAREKVLREALQYSEVAWEAQRFLPRADVQDALAMPYDSTTLDAMLKQAKREALLEYAELRRMAEEL